jgi:hypothetical protein
MKLFDATPQESLQDVSAEFPLQIVFDFAREPKFFVRQLALCPVRVEVGYYVSKELRLSTQQFRDEKGSPPIKNLDVNSPLGPRT